MCPRGITSPERDRSQQERPLDTLPPWSRDGLPCLQSFRDSFTMGAVATGWSRSTGPP